MKSNASYLPLSILIWIFLQAVHPIQAENEDKLIKIIQLPALEATIYEHMERLTNLSGFLFIYDSKVIDNKKVVRIEEGSYTIRQAIDKITGNPGLDLRVKDNYISIQLPTKVAVPVVTDEIPADTISTHFTIEGTLVDQYTEVPIAHASVSVTSNGIGTITNQNGDFRLRLPDSLRHSIILFSHIGYISKNMDIEPLVNKQNRFALESRVISIQEIVVRLVNPQRLIRNMLDNRKLNYATEPVYLTTFYREGIERKKGFVNMTEAVFKVFKVPFSSPRSSDQIKLLKMRRISNEAEKDTLITKFKSGINASMLLDVIKYLPDFLAEEERMQYNFVSSDITIVDGRTANVISFEQKKIAKDPLFKGELYIDAENDALLMAKFEIHPKYVEKAANIFVVKKSRKLDIKPQRIAYTVSYKKWDDKYYINHIRGDLYFRVKKKRQLFSSTPIHTWFEMVTCKIETGDVVRFSRNEILPTKTIFSETNFLYDEAFWGDFNVILPEEELSNSISKITFKIEETEEKQ